MPYVMRGGFRRVRRRRSPRFSLRGIVDMPEIKNGVVGPSKIPRNMVAIVGMGVGNNNPFGVVSHDHRRVHDSTAFLVADEVARY